MGFEQKLQIANITWTKRKLEQIYDCHKVNVKSFLDLLLRDRITWHWGGMSDPFQPAEATYNITAKMIELTNQYDISCLFSTKSDSYYMAKLNPKLHSLQLSVTNLKNSPIEPNVAPIESRIRFFKKLKDEGFRVGIRLQPFIPHLTDDTIIDVFREANYFSIEGIKLVPQNEEQKIYLCKTLGLKLSDFIQMGLLNLKPNIRMKLYQKVIDKLEAYGIPYSIADNDLHYLTKSKCCCGEPLITKSTDFNNTALFYTKGDYKLTDVMRALGDYQHCTANYLFASNRQENCCTVSDFYIKRFSRKTSPFSKRFIYGGGPNQLTLFTSAKRGLD